MTDINYTAIKKDFQKVIKSIREQISAYEGKTYEFPKAMMTGQQMDKNTATVNCGGEWRSAEYSKEIADVVMTHSEFQVFLIKYQAKAHIEENKFGGVQIRINY